MKIYNIIGEQGDETWIHSSYMFEGDAKAALDELGGEMDAIIDLCIDGCDTMPSCPILNFSDKNGQHANCVEDLYYIIRESELKISASLMDELFCSVSAQPIS